MKYPPEVSADKVADQFCAALRACERSDVPYRTWKLKDVYPEELCTGILTLPICPVFLGDTDGTRGTYNDYRTFFNPELRRKFQACQALADALQRPSTARLLADTLATDVDGSYLRMEYIQDVDGCWLEPHCDIYEKIFSMVIYLFYGPDSVEWGTDIYDDQKRWIGRSPGTFNSATIFIAGPNTWHGFEKRKINGVRRLMEINYVRPNWRRREQLSFPDQPISLR